MNFSNPSFHFSKSLLQHIKPKHYTQICSSLSSKAIQQKAKSTPLKTALSSKADMATSLALKRATASSLFNRLVNNVRSASVVRSFNTNTQMTAFDEDDRAVDVDRRDRSVSRRRDAFPTFFSDVFDPFSPPRSVSQLLNMMDQMMDSPFSVSPRGIGTGVLPRRGWDVKEDDNALYLKMDMPGLDKENVKVSVEENVLVIKGEGEKESEDEEYRRRYSTRLEIPPNLYKLDGIKAEMKNGVLKVAVPKVKEEERKDVFNVQVE